MAKKILIIEDEDLLLNILEKKLSNKGYKVSVAVDGEEGLEKIRKVLPDLILLDILMPKKDGFEVLDEMRRDETIKDIPVIIISNSGQYVEIERIKKMGVKDWLVKTDFNPENVINKVEKQIGQA
ncbi:MAG: response regulator [Patescibacteria group bacterium]|nr:response regulator [Patescibacteria group bacterium]